MKVKNLTPLLFGTCVTSRMPPQPEVVAVVRGLFTLAPGERAILRSEPAPFPQGFMSGDTFRDGDDERAGDLLYPSDFAAYKPRADVLLKGTAYAPGGSPVTELGVKIAVGSWSKSLRIVGPRVYSDSMAGAAISAPLAFTRMPLDYTNSFGGPGYAQNPVGKGFTTAELPNIEAAGAPVRSRRDRLDPAGFGPINPAWPQRRKKLGKEYGRSWAEGRAPYYAEDFDWTYFNAAPEDQQLPSYLRGDEELSLYNLHPALPLFTARLPGLRARVFIKDIEGRFRELPMNLDTLLVDMNAATATLTWRGLDKVREDDLADIKTALVASEPLERAPLPAEHYRGILEQFEADPLELRERVPEELRKFVDPALAFAPTEAAPPASLDAALEQRLGTAARPEQEQIKKLVERVAAASKPAIDMDPFLAKAAREGPPKAPPLLRSVKPGGAPPVRVREAVQAIERTVQSLKRAAAERGITIKNIAELEKLSSDPRLLALDPSLGVGAGSPPREPGPGQDLSGQDLRGRDLRGRDLRGANFTGALLSEADLRGAALGGANFKLAILFSAALDGADLTGADLTMANLAKARAPGANLRGARLDQALFDEADLTGAVLAEANGESTFFTNCRMNDLKAAKARFTQAFFEGSTLERADFTGAHLVRSRLLRCIGLGSKLDGATLTKSSFSESNFTGASFTDVWGEGSIWLKAALARADFGYALLVGAHFTEAVAPAAKFNAANLKRARFYRAKLDGAIFTQANLFEADLSKTSLHGAKFTGASLYGAKLLQASGAGADFMNANLKRSTLERA